MDSSREIVQIVDRDNQETDQIPRKIMREKKLIHRATYILVFNDQKQLFIQKRTMCKDVYPGYWDIAAGGVVLAGESYHESAVRELQEELGVSGVEFEERFDFFHDTADNRVWGRIYTCQHNGPFTLQKEEIDEGRFLTIQEIFSLHEKSPVTPDGIPILQLLEKQNSQPLFFLHGLDSSSRGTKGRYFARHFPEMYAPDFDGPLATRNSQLEKELEGKENITLVGSSFGGLMATCQALSTPEKIRQLILLAPALNFEEFTAPPEKCRVPAILYIGKNDTVCPPEQVIPMAEQTFSDLTIHLVDDDHMLHDIFTQLDWQKLLYG